MRRPRLAVTAALALALGGACGSSGEPASSTMPDASVDAPPDPGVLGCMRICTMVAELQCSMQTDCLGPCLTQLEGDCKNATRSLVACAMAQPTTAFHCANGIGMIGSDVCLDEMAAINACIRSSVDEDAGLRD